MSYSISINGHSSADHNQEVKEIAEDAARKLQALPGATVSLSGYSNDSTGRIELVTPAPEVQPQVEAAEIEAPAPVSPTGEAAAAADEAIVTNPEKEASG